MVNDYKKSAKENNLEFVVRDCIEQFEKHKKCIILVHIDQNFYEEFKSKLLNFYKNSIVFIVVSGNINIEMVREIYKNKKVIVYDKFRKTETYWIFNMPKEKRASYFHMDVDFFLNSNNQYY